MSTLWYVVYGGVLSMGMLAFIPVAIWPFAAVVRSFMRCLTARSRSGVGQRVRIVGSAHAIGEPIAAPISGRPCLAYSASPDARARVVTFCVHDDTGTLDIAIEHVALDLAGHWVKPDDAHAFGHMEQRAGVLEDRLDPDQRVAVIGIALRRGDGTFHLVGTARQPLVISTRRDVIAD